jgi:hypothetical protein
MGPELSAASVSDECWLFTTFTDSAEDLKRGSAVPMELLVECIRVATSRCRIESAENEKPEPSRSGIEERRGGGVRNVKVVANTLHSL